MSSIKKPKPRRIKFELREPVYRSIVTFFIGYSFKEFNAIVEKYRHEKEKPLDQEYRDSLGMAVTMRNKSDEICHTVWLQHFSWDVKPLGVLAHELGHIIFAILDHKQVPIRIENDEAFCYLYEFYYMETLRKLNKK